MQNREELIVLFGSVATAPTSALERRSIRITLRPAQADCAAFPSRLHLAQSFWMKVLLLRQRNRWVWRHDSKDGNAVAAGPTWSGVALARKKVAVLIHCV